MKTKVIAVLLSIVFIFTACMAYFILHSPQSKYVIWKTISFFASGYYRANYATGIAELNQNQNSQAQLYFERAVKAKPDSIDANYNLANSLFKQGNIPKAFEYYSKTVELCAYAETINGAQHNFEKAEALLKIAGFKQLSGDLAGANSAYLKAIDANPNNPELYYHCGAFYVNSNKLGLAEVYIKKAIDLKKDYIDAYLLLGSIHNSWQKYDLALENYKTVLGLDANNPSALYNAALMYDKLKNPIALEAWQKAVTQWQNSKLDNATILKMERRINLLKGNIKP